MKPSEALIHHRATIAALARKHRLHSVRVFGSTARGEDTETSDLDLLVDPTPNVTTLFDLVAFKNEAAKILRVNVDVRTPAEIHERFRQQVLDEAQPLDPSREPSPGEPHPRSRRSLRVEALDVLLRREWVGVMKARDWELLEEIAAIVAQDAPRDMAASDPAQFRALREAITDFHVRGYTYMTPERVREVAVSDKAQSDQKS